MFSLLRSVTATEAGDAVEKLTDWELFQSFASKLISPNIQIHSSYPRGGGSNTSTVILRVVGGDEKGNLESETVKYGHESYGTRTRK
jgi:hypothetical protein